MPSNEKPQILCILFSDLKGYSDLRNDRLKNQIVKQMNVFVECNQQPGVQRIKTMGDGLMIGGSTPLALAELALQLRDWFKNTDWKAQGFPDDFLIRIGLPVDEMIVHFRDDGTIKDVIGVGVDTTARIEPVTEPNTVFCSNRFYEMLQSKGIRKITGILQGHKALAKQYGEMELYELRWSHETGAKETPMAQPSAVVPSIPMPNIKKLFTELERRDFLLQAFATIRAYFNTATTQLQKNERRITTKVSDVSDTKFICEIYSEGQLKARGKIWLGDFGRSSQGEIYFSEDQSGISDDGSYNDGITAVDDGKRMYLKAWLAGVMFSRREPDVTKPSSPEQIAEYLWIRLTQVLE